MHGMHLLVLLLLVSAPLHAGNAIARAYSDFIHTLAYSVTSTHRDMVGTELESKHVAYNDQPVTFQYQLWRLRKDSVCAQLRHNVLEYSKCTRAARALFTDTCRHLTNNPSDHWRHQKQKNLYCAASVEFKPVVAEVRRSTAADDHELQKRQQCSVLRIQAMSSRDPKTIQMRDEVCGG